MRIIHHTSTFRAFIPAWRFTLWASISALSLLSACSPETAAPSAPLSQGALLTVSCANCHAGPGGLGDVPSISNLSSVQMKRSLLRYKAETEGTTVMHYMSRGWTTEQIEAISNMWPNL